MCPKIEIKVLYSKTRKRLTVISVRGARGVMVSVAGYGHGDTSSITGPD